MRACVWPSSCLSTRRRRHSGERVASRTATVAATAAAPASARAWPVNSTESAAASMILQHGHRPAVELLRSARLLRRPHAMHTSLRTAVRVGRTNVPVQFNRDRSHQGSRPWRDMQATRLARGRKSTRSAHRRLQCRSHHKRHLAEDSHAWGERTNTPVQFDDFISIHSGRDGTCWQHVATVATKGAPTSTAGWEPHPCEASRQELASQFD